MTALLARRKVATVSWSGCRLAATNRTVTSRQVARSILRDEKIPLPWHWISRASISRDLCCGMPPVRRGTSNAPGGTRSTAATAKCVRSSSGSQAFRPGGIRKAWSRLNGAKFDMPTVCSRTPRQGAPSRQPATSWDR